LLGRRVVDLGVHDPGSGHDEAVRGIARIEDIGDHHLSRLVQGAARRRDRIAQLGPCAPRRWARIRPHRHGGSAPGRDARYHLRWSRHRRPARPEHEGEPVAQIAITLDGSAQHIDGGTTGTELYADTASIIALRIDGELRDLYTPLAAGQVVEGVDISSPDGLSILRHSAAHVLAQAVQKTNPDAKLGIGPPITDGFYYDFDVAEPFTPESLKALEKEM